MKIETKLFLITFIFALIGFLEIKKNIYNGIFIIGVAVVAVVIIKKRKIA